MSKRLTLVKRLALIFVLSALIIVGYRFYIDQVEKTCSSYLHPSFTSHFDLLKGRSPLDTSLFRLNNRLYFVLAYMTKPDSPYRSTPVLIYSLDETGRQQGSAMPFGETQHVRSMTKLATPWGEGILMADHGIDGGNFPGGYPLLITKESDRPNLTDRSRELRQLKNFAFNGVGVRRTHSRYDDILIAPYNSPNARVVYLKATDHGYEDASILLPESWRNFRYCFMTAMPFDKDGDGKDEIALGSCDLDSSQTLSPRDRLLEWKNSGWSFTNEDIFPPRKQGPSWGTVYWLKEGKNLVALTHNKGFTKADIQFFNFNEGLQKFVQPEVLLSSATREKSSFYFHKIQKFKDEYYVLIRYGTPDFKKPNLLALKKDEKGNMKEEQVCLATPPGETVLGLDSFPDEKGSGRLILTYYSGRYDVFQ